MQDESLGNVRDAAAAHALEEHAATFARERLGNWRSQAAVSSELESARKIFDKALSRVAAEWNSQHDRLRRLPLELVVRCWSLLDIQELVRTTAICREWRMILLATPALWSSLDFHVRTPGHCEQLGILLQHSKGVSLTLTVRMGGDLFHPLCAVLRGHSHRLYRLDLLESQPWRRYDYDDYAPTNLRLDFECPILHSFTSGVSHLALNTSTFRGCAPALQHVQFQHPPIIPAGDPPTFHSVTSLELNQSPGTLLLAAFPRLVRLEIHSWCPLPHSDLSRPPVLPATLQHVILNGPKTSYTEISRSVFVRVRLLEIREYPYGGFLKLFSEFGGVPSAASTQGCLVTLSCEFRNDDEPGGSPKTVSVSSIGYGGGYTRVLDLPSICDNVRSLSLYLGHFPRDDPYSAGDDAPTLPSQEFPMLQTLVLTIDSAETGVRHALLHLEVMKGCGTLRAPNLRRLVISRVPGRPRRPRDPVRIPLANLTLFITHHLELAPGRMLDEVVLEQGRAMLEDKADGYAQDLEVFESFVGTIRVDTIDSLETLASCM